MCVVFVVKLRVRAGIGVNITREMRTFPCHVCFVISGLRVLNVSIS